VQEKRRHAAPRFADSVEKTGHINELTLDYTTGTEMLPWSRESLRATQRVDPDIVIIITPLEAKAEKPDWESVAMKSHEVKVL